MILRRSLAGRSKDFVWLPASCSVSHSVAFCRSLVHGNVGLAYRPENFEPLQKY